MIRRIILATLLLVLLTFFTKTNLALAQCTHNGVFPYDWETVHLQSGGSLSVSQPAMNLPDGTPITFSVLTKSGEGNGMINTAGAQGGWDMQGGISGSCGSGDIPGIDQLDKHYAMLAAIGVRYANLSMIWPYIENTQGHFNFQKLYDPVFKTAKKYNINLVPNLSNTPRWATVIPCQTTPTNTCKQNLRCEPADITRANGSTYFNNFVRKAVERYKPNGTFYRDYPEEANSGRGAGYGISNWVIWNEPDNGPDRFWTDCSGLVSTPPGQDVENSGRDEPRGSITEYADLFSGAYDTIKGPNGADRTAKVLLAGLVLYDKIEGNKYALEVIYDRFNQTGNSKPDIINLHSYQPCKYDWQGNPTTTCTFKDVVAANAHKASELDPTKKVWLVEFGPILTYTPAQINEFLLESAPFTFNYVRSYPLVGNQNFDKTFWWPSRGNLPQDPQDPGTIFGLMHPCFEPRETYFTAGKMNNAISQNRKVSGSVIGGKIKTTTPIQFTQGKFIVIATSPSKMVINKPIAVFAGEDLPACPTCIKGPDGDLDCNGVIGENDLVLLLASWAPAGPAPTPIAGHHSADITGDDRVDGGDYNKLLGNWIAQ